MRGKNTVNFVAMLIYSVQLAVTVGSLKTTKNNQISHDIIQRNHQYTRKRSRPMDAMDARKTY